MKQPLAKLPCIVPQRGTWGFPIVDRQTLDKGKRVIETDSEGNRWELERLERVKSTLGTTTLFKVIGPYVPRERSVGRRKENVLAALAKEFV